MKIRLIAAPLSGVALWVAFAPLEFWPAAFVGLALLYWSLADQRLRNRVALSMTSGFSFFALLLHWSSTYVGAAPWLILALGEGLLFSLLGLLPIQRSLKGVLLFGSGFLLIELLRMKFPFGGFGWGRVGFTQVDSLGGVYPLIGVAGVSLLVALLAAISIVDLKFFLLLPIAIIINLLIAPSFAMNDASEDGFKVVAVQGGVDKLGFAYNDRALRVLERHVAATPTNSDAQLILWPENSVDVDPRINKFAKDRLETLFDELDQYLLTGTVEQSVNGPVNTSNLYDADGVLISKYEKQDLAPFGEYIPLRWIAERVSPFARQVRDFIPGDNWMPHKINGWKFQSFICFEVLDDDHIKNGANGMDFLIAQTNNATFGDSAQAAQQLQITQARAAELRKDFSVVSTTGYSAHIDSQGKIVKSAPKFEPKALDMILGKSGSESLASRLGSEFWLLVALIGVALGTRTNGKFIR